MGPWVHTLHTRRAAPARLAVKAERPRDRLSASWLGRAHVGARRRRRAGRPVAAESPPAGGPERTQPSEIAVQETAGSSIERVPSAIETLSFGRTPTRC